MSITIITGKPGVGKTSLNAYFCQRTYVEEREQLLKRARSYIERINESRETPLTLPELPPIYTNFEVNISVGYKKYYSPYYVNPYYLGLSNDNLNVQYLPPSSRVFISEAQRYYNSRKSQSLADWVSRWYEMHRHFDIEIIMDVQRGKLIDLNVRELCRKFIEVQRMEHEYGEYGITKTRWYCREFDNNQDYEEYLDGKSANYVESVYEYSGNIFELYNSTSCFDEFVPVKGDFSYLPYKPEGKPSEADAIYYVKSEPKGFRGAAANKKQADKGKVA